MPSATAAKSWREMATRPDTLPDHFDERIDPSAIFLLPHNPDTGEPGEVFVTAGRSDNGAAEDSRAKGARAGGYYESGTGKAWKVRDPSTKGYRRPGPPVKRKSVDVPVRLLVPEELPAKRVRRTRFSLPLLPFEDEIIAEDERFLRRGKAARRKSLAPSSIRPKDDPFIIGNSDDNGADPDAVEPKLKRSRKRKSDAADFLPELSSADPASGTSRTRRKSDRVEKEPLRKDRRTKRPLTPWKVVKPSSESVQPPFRFATCRPRIWTSSHTELLEVFPALSTATNDVWWDETSLPTRPVVVLRGRAWHGDGVRDYQAPVPPDEPQPYTTVERTASPFRQPLVIRIPPAHARHESPSPPSAPDEPLSLRHRRLLQQPEGLTPMTESSSPTLTPVPLMQEGQDPGGARDEALARHLGYSPDRDASLTDTTPSAFLPLPAAGAQAHACVPVLAGMSLHRRLEAVSLGPLDLSRMNQSPSDPSLQTEEGQIPPPDRIFTNELLSLPGEQSRSIFPSLTTGSPDPLLVLPPLSDSLRPTLNRASSSSSSARDDFVGAFGFLDETPCARSSPAMALLTSRSPDALLEIPPPPDSLRPPFTRTESGSSLARDDFVRAFSFLDDTTDTTIADPHPSAGDGKPSLPTPPATPAFRLEADSCDTLLFPYTINPEQMLASTIPIPSPPITPSNRAAEAPNLSQPAESSNTEEELECPDEIRALMRAKSEGVTVVLIAEREWLGLPADAAGKEWGCSMLGYFAVSEYSRGVLSPPPEEQRLNAKCIRWTFRFEWAPDGDTILLAGDDAYDAFFNAPPSSPWWNTALPVAPRLPPEELEEGEIEMPDDAQGGIMDTYECSVLQDVVSRSALGYGAADDPPMAGWYCRACGKLNLTRWLRHQECDNCPVPDVPQSGFAVCVDSIRTHIRAGDTTIYDRSLKWRKRAHAGGATLQTIEFPLLPDGLVNAKGKGKETFGVLKYLNLNNRRELQREASEAFLGVQADARMAKWVDGAHGRRLGYHNAWRYLAGRGHVPHDGEVVTNWNDVPESIHTLKCIMLDRCRASGEPTARIDQLSVLVWMGSGRRSGIKFPKRDRPTVILCLGNDLTIDVFPQGRGRNAIAAAVQEERSAGPELATEVQADTAGDTVNLSQMEIVPEREREMRLIEGSEDALMPPPPAPAVVPATASRPAPGKKTAQKKDPSVLVTLAHGDALVLAGCDFEDISEAANELWQPQWTNASPQVPGPGVGD
ncbi:hypothetical protein GLOTRDRAFT_120744 [Gloeophyllum trabeum ATCC 11539]|uniref:Uncharacterized protein n=1 Tax=Gloeophyllum trabeum (strain ATCC 11539 / FP-39264 / Madison 617) TaxID=670483 RepID=S7Q989_GLOTA|nr:uncharacterized protein GLOTRDRAFT_120744 [Gloeophyllum trabeum ATCC 11539]EPQ56077.1 hypothetical protein GLOTRDRAFT_120744 [Gloeophyllum trabeum ATCC 11539]